MSKKFLHCLRIQFYPNHFEDDRIAEVVDFCVKYRFDNVMLFINAEEYNVGHMTIQQAKPWIATMKKAKAALTEKGITVSLNPWIEIGHLDRCRPLQDGQNFTTQVDYDGNQCEMVACPLCENWKKYFFEFYTYLLKELQPDTVWVEDDFRLHNHGDLKFGGCFCHLHMQRYNQLLGTNYTREQFTDKLFRKNPDKRVKKAWLDVNRQCMASLAEEIGKLVADLHLGTKVGLMSSRHEKHALEGRDWHRLHKGLAMGGPIINRLHLPCYNEISAKEYYLDFNQEPFHCRALLPEQTVVYPELENASFSTFSKEARFVRFQLESAIPLCIEGITYDIYDFVGNGIVDNFGYGQAIEQITPYLDGVTNLNLHYKQLDGIILPIDEKTVYKRDAEIKGFDDLYPDEAYFNAYITSLGVNCKVSTKKDFHNKVVALGGGNAYNFTTKQLQNLFENNFVLLDGGAARILIDRGLGYLFGATQYKTHVAEHDVHSYEQVADGIAVCGKYGYRATAFGKAGDYVSITYDNPQYAQSYVYDYLGNKVGVGIYNNGKCYVVPYVINKVCLEQYNNLRTTLLQRFLQGTDERLVYTNHAGVYAYLYDQSSRKVLIVVNSTEEDFSQTTLKLQNINFTSLWRIDKTSGKKRKTAYQMQDGVCTIAQPNEHLSTQTFILK